MSGMIRKAGWHSSLENVRELIGQAQFHGRHAVLSLPASMMHIQHLRLAKMDDAALKKAIPRETRGKLPIDPSNALLRHLVAGEIYHEQESKIEVIVMAAERDWIAQFLAAAAKAKLDVIGMNVEPTALVDCFTHVYRRKTDRESTQCFVDIGAGASPGDYRAAWADSFCAEHSDSVGIS